MKKRFYPLRLSVAVSGALALVAVPLLIVPAHAQVRPTHRPDVPALDSRAPTAGKPERTAERERGKAHLAAQLPSAAVDFDPLLDAPKFIRAGAGFLTGPNGQGLGVSALAAKALSADDPHLPIKAFLNEHHELFGYGAEVLSGARVKRDYVDKHNGLHTIVWEQQLDGIPLFQSVLMGHITRQGELTSLSSVFVPDLAASADAGTPGRAAIQSAPPVSAAQAVALAARNLGMTLADAEVVAAGGPVGEDNYLVFKTPEEAYTRLVWLPLHRSSLRLGWEVMVSSHATKERFRLVIDAQTGEVRIREGLTAYISDASYNVYTSDSPSPFSPGLQVPGNLQPPLTNRFLIVTPALDTNASPAGWIPDGSNTTTGNNVDAFVDRNFDQQPDQPRPTGNPNRVFDFPLDLNQDPKSYIDASTVQLFWRANWYHDRLYELGFTEAAGNYQVDNFGRGGLGNDSIICYVQSGADVGIADNSMFAPAPDGQNGQCFMFVFSGTTPQRDGSLDSEVVCHELTHGTSWRLVGGGMTLGSMQGDGMGEGWSDFYALCLLGEPSDDPNAAYPMGGYVTYLFAGTGMTENYYFGIRHFPYCTDMAKNPFTFKDIDPAQISPHTGVPRSPIYPFYAQEANEVHHQGEVWCVTLWGMHANLVAKYGWTKGNEMTLQLVTDGLKLTPPAPTFLQARDAILLADQIDNAGANSLAIWSAFARRGMGFSARSPDSSTTAGVVEAYDMPGVFVDHVVVTGGNGNGVIDNNECNDLSIFLGNNAGFTVTSVSGRLSCSTLGVIVVQPLSTYPIILNGATNANTIPFRISTAPAFVCGTPLDCTLIVKSDQLLATNQFRILTGIPGTPLRFDNSTPAPIPDMGETNSVMVVSNVTSALSKVTVAMYITHTYDSDLLIQLISPDGTTNTLSASNGLNGQNYGAGCSPDSQRTTFDDAASQTIGAGSAPFIGNFQPQTPLSVFIGKAGPSVNGNWRLRVVDQAALDVGTLQCWSLFLSPSLCKDGGGECPGADLVLGMAALPEPVLVGNMLTYTISVTNNGPSSAPGVTVTHLLPTGVVFVSATSSQGSCSQAGGVVTGNLGTIAYGSRATISVVVLPATTGTMVSTASVTSGQPDPDPSNNSALVISHVNPVSVDLAAGILAAPTSVIIGGTLTYTISVTNNGPSAGSGVFVTNVLPSSAGVLSATVSQGSITTAGGLWTVGTLASGGSATATIIVVPTVLGTITATTTVGGNQFDPVPANNLAGVSTVVGPAADLSVGIADYPDPAIVLSNVIYAISVTNSGPSDATSVHVSGSLPTGINLISTNATQGAVSIAGNALTWTLGTMNSGARATLTIVVQTTTSGTLTVSATIAGSEPDPNPANNSASATTRVAPAGVAIAAAGATLTAESFTPPNGAIDIGETVTIILRLRNSSNVSTLNLVGTLLATNGVAPISPTTQTYGVLAPSGFPVGRSFTFTASGTNGQTISPTLQLHDGATVYPPVSFNFTLPSSQTFANTNAIAIPDPAAPYPPYPSQAGPGKPYPSVITVGNLNGVLGRVTVTLSNLTHSFSGDINALLVGPNGAKTLLMSHAGDLGITNQTLTFDDSASAPLPATGSFASGAWQPTAYSPPLSFPTNAPSGPYSAALSTFNASSPNGAWSLYVYDDGSGDSGNLFGGWSLTLSMITPVNQLADLGLTAAGAPNPDMAGAALTYTFTVANSGPNPATSVAFTNNLPAGVTLVSASPSQGIAITNGNTVLANLGTLNTGAVATVTVVVVPMPSAVPSGTNTVVLTNTATVGSSETDPNPGNNTASAITTVKLPLADAGVSLAAVPNPAVTGNNLTNTISVTNYGPGTALAVVVTDPLPAGAAVVSANSTSGTCTNSSGTVICSLGDLAASASATITLVLTPSQLGLMTNTVFVATGSQDTNAANNTATYVVTVVGPTPNIVGAGALLTYESGPVNALIDTNETVTLSLSLANVGSLDTVNLKATLLTSGGVTSPSGAQYYGALVHGGPSAARSFTFKAATVLQSAVVATLQLQDERPAVTNSLGPVAFTFSQPSSSAWANTYPITIPDHGIAGPYPSTITVSNLQGMVTKATVALNGLTHPFPHDVNVLLVSPAGGKVLLMSHTGGGYPATNLTLTFDDAAATTLPNYNLITTGTNRPSSYEGPIVFPGAPAGPNGSALAGVDGWSPNGAWSLYVFDDAVGDGGYIAGGWSLSLTTASALRPLTDLSIGMASAPALLFAGTTMTNTINITNAGPDSATGVVLTNPLPAGVNFVSALLSQGNVTGTNGGLVTCSLGTLSAGGTARVTIVLMPTLAGALLNSVSVAANELDLFPTNNSAQTGTTVNKVNSSTAVSSSANPSVWGQSVTFSAIVTSGLPVAIAPTGTVQFKTNGVNFGSAVTLLGGTASSAAISSLAVGSYTVTADYSGDGGFNTSSRTLGGGQFVNKANTTTAVSSLVNPSLFGQSVTFSTTVAAVLPGAGIPTGTVQFKINGANFGGAVALSGGSASSAAISSLAVGNYTVTASYSGDSGFNTSSGTLLGGQTVGKASATTAVSSSVNPSLFGQSVTFGATVAAVPPGVGTPTGTVQFKINGANFGSAVALSGGSASSVAISSLAVGGYTVTVDYSGDSGFNTSSGTLSGGQTVNKASTTTSVSSPVNPSLFGQSVTFGASVAAVAPGTGTPTGTVQFQTNGVNFGSAVALSGGNASSAAISSLAVGNVAVTALYSGDAGFTTSSGTLAGGQTINKADTTTAVTASVNPSVFGQAVTFTATLAAVAPGTGTPTGTVQFKTNGVNFGSAVALSIGSAASATISSLVVGSYTVTADYSGDSGFNTSSGTLAGGQTVNKANSSTAVTSSANPSVFGQSVTFMATLTAVVPGTGTPSGTVQFKTNGVAFGSAVALSGGSASSAAISSLAVGSYTVTADYSGDSGFNTSSGTLAGGQTVNKANSSTAVSSSVNPSVFGQSVTFSVTVAVVSPGAGTLTGTVQFKTNGVNFGSAVALSGGAASSGAIGSLAVGNCAVTADYSGDGSFNASSGTLAGGQTVNKADTTAAVTASANPTVVGQAVTFGATVSAVSPGAGTPTGTVQFKTNGVNFGSAVTLSGGAASSAAISSLAVGTTTVTAVYNGDAGFNTSSGTLAGGQTVNKADTTTVAISSVNPSVFGQSVTFTATLAAVVPGTGTPTGTVQFKTNGVNFGSAVALSGGSASSPASSSLAVGGYTVTADYSGDSGFNTSSGTLAGGQTVNKSSSLTAVASSANPSVSGQSVTFTATLTAAAPGTGTPTGTVQFKTNGVDFGSAVTLSGGSASSPAISSLAVGSYTVIADYSGDSGFNTSSGTLAGSQTVNKANSSTAVSSAANPSAFGQSVTFTVTLTAVAPGTGTPTGTVQFKTNGVNFGSAVALSGGSASSVAIASLAVGSYTVTADYSGDGGFNTSSGTLAGGQTVNKANSATVVSSLVNPSVFGQPVTFSATVTAVAPGAGTLTGTVQFKTNGVNFGSAVALSGGSASSAAISSLAVGTTTVTVVYSGDASFNTSTASSLNQTVNKASSTTVVASSVNPSVFGQPVTFSATVAAVSPGAGTPTGTVQFMTNGVNFGSAVTLSGGSASSAAISSLAVGTPAVTVVYSGDAGFNTSTSSTLSQTVNKADTSAAATSSVNPSVFGQSVTFTATLTAVAPGTGTPTGTVQFKTNGVNFGSAVALSGGSASSPPNSSLAAGTYTVTADYSGDSGFNTSIGTLAGGQTVNKANSLTAVASSANPSVSGQSVTFTAALTTVSPGVGTPTGTVQFKTNGVDLGSAVALSAGSASSAAISSLMVGSYTVTADYSGDSGFNTSSGTLTGGQTVNSNPIPATLTGSIVNGLFHLTVKAQPDYTYVVEGSTNLVFWVPLSTNTASSSGTFNFTDTTSPNPRDRYYRTTTLAP